MATGLALPVTGLANCFETPKSTVKTFGSAEQEAIAENDRHWALVYSIQAKKMAAMQSGSRVFLGTLPILRLGVSSLNSFRTLGSGWMKAGVSLDVDRYWTDRRDVINAYD